MPAQVPGAPGRPYSHTHPVSHPPVQTREALIKILDDLKPNDQFNLISFSGDVTHWKPLLVPASPENVDQAKRYAANIEAHGGQCLRSPAAWGVPGQ